MTDYRLGIKNQVNIFFVYLLDMSALPNLRVNPTLAAGDVIVYKDDVSNGNITTLPVVTPAGSRRVKVSLSANETNCDHTSVQFVDQTATKEWSDHAVEIANGLLRIDDLAPASTALSTAVWTNAKAAFIDAAISSIVSDIFKTDLSTFVGEAPRSLLNAVRKLMNRVRLSAGVLTVYKEDDTATAFTQTVSQDSSQNPIKEVDTT
jgi:hypothetical protein